MSPLTAIAIPAATAAATRLVQQLVAQRPFAQFLRGEEAASSTAADDHAGQLDLPIGQLLEKLRTAIADRLAAARIDPASSFDLTADASGQVEVSDHPLGQQIEEALSGDASIRSMLQQIAALHSLRDISQQELTFAQRYAASPELAQSGSPSVSPIALTFAAGQLQLK